eukprot:CAMPEP_0168747666 /NCGR_PEP_ID=MMETSP0724-20121128/15776_1 /TAXON_ID=265536 /ORGANISM="Amphiprora sp., Strain CCMP467" /LENGTH=550 /DNA_ID=CAMNT_0008795467 /DNA_START=90 /DNA_END=1742 /DNA_ORIENTATION=-
MTSHSENDNDSTTANTNFFAPTSLDFAACHQVFVAEVESLYNSNDNNPGDTAPTSDFSAKPQQQQSDQGLVLVDTIRKPGMPNQSRAFYRAGPRYPLHFQSKPPIISKKEDGGETVDKENDDHDNPQPLNAAIVTAGGLCPGLNNVVRELTLFLYHRYHAHQVWGVRGGWNGFLKKKTSDNDNNQLQYEPILLTPEWVNNIHHQGGSALQTSRGGLDETQVLQFLQQRNISHLYIIGGDGTHRAAYKVHQACRAQNLNIAIAGIPKTIDNDIDYIDRSFGFYSAIEAAQASIRTALVEARCTLPNGVGVVKIMGRSAGFLAAFAALRSGDVDAVLVPEVPIQLRGPNGILPHIFRRVQEKQHAVVVVAEGAGQDLLEQTQETEAGSGNPKLMPIAEYIRDQIIHYFQVEQGQQVRMKYLDPSYSVRSVPANATDSLYCTQLAHNAVHGCMSGLTGFSCGMVNNRTVYIPIPQLVATSPRSMDPNGPIWDRILAMTGQPNPSQPAAALSKVNHSPTSTNDKDRAQETPLGGTASTTSVGTSFPKLPEPTVH